MDNSPPARNGLWTYQARAHAADHAWGVVDGDTLDLTLDLGLHVHSDTRVRLAGVDTAETWNTSEGSPEHERGEEHTRATRGFVRHAHLAWGEDEWPLLVRTMQDDRGKYGRLLAVVRRRSDGRVLNEALRSRWPSVEE